MNLLERAYLGACHKLQSETQARSIGQCRWGKVADFGMNAKKRGLRQSDGTNLNLVI